MAVGTKTGGRKKGVPNKRTAAEKVAIAASGEMPKEYMLRVMRDESIDDDRRDRMAERAAPYFHSRLTSTEVTGKDGGPIETADVSDQKRVAAVALLAAREALKGANSH